MNVDVKKISLRLLVFTTVIFIFWAYCWFLLAAFFAQPNAEDLSLIANAKKDGILTSAAMLLNTYDGRFFTNILHGLNPLYLGFFFLL